MSPDTRSPMRTPAVFAVLLVLYLCTSCQAPLASGTGTAGGTGSTTGTVIISVPRLSPTVVSAVLESSPSECALAGSAARAYTVADRAVFTLYKSGTRVDTWEAAASGTVPSTPAVTSTHAMEPGTYTVKVDLYDNQTSSTTPAVSGTSAAFTITANASTAVGVYCTPTSPATLTWGVSSGTITLGSCWTASGEETVVAGSTAWYSFTVPTSTESLVSTGFTFTGGSATKYAVAFLYDAAGRSVTSLGSTAGATTESLSAGATYYLAIIGVDRADDSSALSCSLTVDTSSVDISGVTPTAYNPYTGGTEISLTPAFYWSDVSGATGYDLYYDTDPTAGSEAKVSGITTSPYTLAGPLANNTTYYWRVVAKNEKYASLSSAIHSFTTEKLTGFTAPAYVSPGNGSTVYPVGKFAWNAVSGATKYTLKISTASDASGLISWDMGTSCTCPCSSYFYLPGTTWYWKVIAEDSSATSADTSAVWSFTPPATGVAAPTGLTSDTGSGKLVLSWNPVTVTGKTVTYHVLMNYGDADFTPDSMSHEVAVPTYTWPYAANNPLQSIYWTVVAVDSDGNTSYTDSLANVQGCTY